MVLAEWAVGANHSAVPFRSILGGFAAHHPAVRAVVFCDEEGERVASLIQDTSLDAYALDVLGASLAPLMPSLARQGNDTCVRILREGEVVWLRTVNEAYYVVVLSRRANSDPRIGDALADVAEALREHM